MVIMTPCRCSGAHSVLESRTRAIVGRRIAQDYLRLSCLGTTMPSRKVYRTSESNTRSVLYRTGLPLSECGMTSPSILRRTQGFVSTVGNLWTVYTHQKDGVTNTIPQETTRTKYGWGLFVMPYPRHRGDYRFQGRRFTRRGFMCPGSCARFRPARRL